MFCMFMQVCDCGTLWLECDPNFASLISLFGGDPSMVPLSVVNVDGLSFLYPEYFLDFVFVLFQRDRAFSTGHLIEGLVQFVIQA